MEDQHNKKELAAEHNEISIELTTIIPNGIELNQQEHMLTVDNRINSSSMSTIDIFNQEEVTETIDNPSNALNTSSIGNHRITEIIAEKRDSRLVCSSHDAGKHLAPIIGYADEPLLPLSKACAPLCDIIHNLSFYVQLALNETSEQPTDGLTIDESAAIRLYTIEWETSHRSLYSMLNYTLKNSDREHLRPYLKYLKLLLTALVKLPCVPPLTIWRGVTKDLSANFPSGTAVTWWAFSSCTTELPVLESNMYLGNSGARTLFSVEAINARRVDAHSHFVGENEVLLLPGTHMIVQSQFSPATDLHVIHLKQVIPEETLLQPPFEGSLDIFNHLFSFILFFCIGADVYPKAE